MFQNATKLRVRYGETDQMGYMYYGNYAEFFEVGRVEMLRSLGLTYSGMEASGIMMPVLELKCKYLKPARYDEEITINVIMDKMPGVKIHFRYELFNEREELIHLGETLLAFVNMKSNRPCLPPADFIEKLKPFFE
ncbi:MULTISPECIES: thioesterase family protein [unclassified Mucilaginibacter]|uniref:acyl-CoA thioesterase n=1 Tax=unclassified Mucilaginibacter TaxID=2617802 RepID=UPI002AC96D23|nr:MULTISPECIES: thioesterase family protein [unclassified Mucilaginibacter]MEB0249764.1 thioesterase family protein [Mucilaginibacter sp. 5B2]MEB0279574.1 thioesterase family protein [Mucilaginibacter sp. 10B2]MEB0302025.1 thioesterase family protein [Mucilaginibacter sp. 5C4]WPX22558.1 thioesterase family protein [Mucilaginibacter sp. 5C4]